MQRRRLCTLLTRASVSIACPTFLAAAYYLRACCSDDGDAVGIDRAASVVDQAQVNRCSGAGTPGWSQSLQRRGHAKLEVLSQQGACCCAPAQLIPACRHHGFLLPACQRMRLASMMHAVHTHARWVVCVPVQPWGPKPSPFCVYPGLQVHVRPVALLLQMACSLQPPFWAPLSP